MLREINEFEIESEKKYDIFCLFSESCTSVSEHLKVVTIFKGLLLLFYYWPSYQFINDIH